MIDLVNHPHHYIGVPCRKCVAALRYISTNTCTRGQLAHAKAQRARHRTQNHGRT